MDPEEAENLQLKGRYGELLRTSLHEQALAERDGRKTDALRWSLVAARTCGFIGRTEEAITHAARAATLASETSDPDLAAKTQYVRGVALRGARRYDEALQALQAALDALPAGRAEELRAEIHLETSGIALEAGLRDRASEALARGSALVHWLREPRLLAWSLFLRSAFETPSPADLQLTAAYEIARTVDCPELQWQILWKLSDRAAQQGRTKMQDDCLWSAITILSRLAAPLDPADATSFWRHGSRRTFVDQAKRRFGAQFFQKVMLEGTPPSEDAGTLLRDVGFDSNAIPDFGRPQA